MLNGVLSTCKLSFMLHLEAPWKFKEFNLRFNIGIKSFTGQNKLKNKFISYLFSK